jgi:formylglycine-generating enzyme required for sulfatase activity
MNTYNGRERADDCEAEAIAPFSGGRLAKLGLSCIQFGVATTLTTTSLVLGLMLSVWSSQGAVAGSDASCEVNMTCDRETKVVAPEPSRGPGLSDWRLLARDTVAPVPASGEPVPRAFEDAVTGMRFVLIRGGCYLRGWSSGTSKEVCLDPYYIGAYEVTFDEYDRFASATDRDLPDDEGWGRGRRPAINVSVYDALNFAKWLSRKAGVHYRLPTEVEWEHAARAGHTSVYPWGNALGENRANCDGCGSRWDDERTAPVGSFAPNVWGLYDVAGNVGEWTCSMRDPDPAFSFERCDSIYKTRRRVFKNGGWSDGPESLAMSFRDWNVAMRRSDDVGFRLLRECTACKSPEAPPRQRRLTLRVE